MEKLHLLNSICSSRKTSRAIPAQIFCRLLGNRNNPCVIDFICNPSNRFGLGLFYAFFATLALIASVVIFWVFSITRVNKLLGFLWRLLKPPIKWLIVAILELRDLTIW